MKRHQPRKGFTLLELTVTIGVILILISILVPTVSRVRRSAWVASAKNQISQLQGAIDRFHQEQGSYPGPLPDGSLATNLRGATAPVIYDETTGSAMADADKITQSENLVLGLLGGLKWKDYSGTLRLTYDPAMIGKGMISMNPGQPKKFTPYIDLDPKMLSAYPNVPGYTGYVGPYTDGGGTAADSRIPELLDSAFPNPMPILYMRAHVGAAGVVRNDVPQNPADPVHAYVLSDVMPYTMTGSTGSIGEGKSIRAADYKNAAVMPSPGVFPHGLQSVTTAASMDKSSANYKFPFDAVPYLLSPAVTPTIPADPNGSGTARSADSYILISAGADRVYGTADDICSFGDVTP